MNSLQLEQILHERVNRQDKEELVAYLLQKQEQVAKLFAPSSIFEMEHKDINYLEEESVQGFLLEEEERSLVELGNPTQLRLENKHQVIQNFRKYKSIYCHYENNEELYFTGQILYILISHKGDRFVTGSSNGLLKIFDSFSVKLQHSINPKVEVLSLMILSKDDRFLIIADSNCLLHIYDFNTYLKISQINNLRNSEVIFMETITSQGQNFLIVCTKEHGLWIYKQSVFDNTPNSLPFDQLSKLLLPFNQWSCCEISQKTGRINAVDSKGTLHSWTDIAFIFEDNRIESESKIIFDSRYRPEILLVNENYGLILLYNKNTHFFIKVEGQNFSIILEERYPKINWKTHERSVVVDQNSRYCFVAINVERKKEDSTAEIGEVNSSVFIYEFISNSRIKLIAKVTTTLNFKTCLHPNS